jgi:hypothetical protein
MATTIYPDQDGIVYKYATDTWANIRNASIGTLNTNASYWIDNSHTSGRGGNTYNIGRYFLEFDTRAINKTISSATLNLYGYSSGTLDVILMKGLQHTPVATNDFNNIYGATDALVASDGSGTGSFVSASYINDVVFYSDEITTWSTSGYNEIVLSDDAKADIIANDSFFCVLMGFDYDVRDTTPSSATYRTGFRTDAYSGTSSDPKLVITEQENSVFFGTNF